MNYVEKLEFKLIENFTEDTKNKLLKLIDSDPDGYEPFYDFENDNILQFGAFDNSGQMIAFLSVLSDELTALIHPDYRKCGIFTALFNYADNKIADYLKVNNIPCSKLLACLPDYMKKSSFSVKPAFKELLMMLTEADYLKFSDVEYNKAANTIKNIYPDIESTFLDDNLTYVCYKNENDDEPCAVLNIDCQASFTNIYGVYVDEEYRHLGIGRFLMTNFIKEYFEAYRLPLVLNVRDNNKAASTLYRKLGFVEKGNAGYYYLNI